MQREAYEDIQADLERSHIRCVKRSDLWITEMSDTVEKSHSLFLQANTVCTWRLLPFL